MKAAVITDKQKPVEVWEVAGLKAGPGEAIVRVHAAALNHRDVWIQKGQYAGLKYPVVPGSDGAGVVVEVGGGIGDWVGKEVIINPSLDWGESAGYQDPGSFRILGLPDDGTFAEYVKVPVQNLVGKPAHLSFEEAAALPLAGVTAYRALMTRAQARAGEKSVDHRHWRRGGIVCAAVCGGVRGGGHRDFGQCREAGQSNGDGCRRWRQLQG